jgi:ATP-dependent Clp protease ATP-binding subunit ClpC
MYGIDKFDKFTEQARKVLSLSQGEAQRFQHNYIGTEHLLLGLLHEREGVAAKVFADFGVELNKARNAVEFIIGRGDRIVLGEIGFTPRAKRAIGLAVDEAHCLNQHSIGTDTNLRSKMQCGPDADARSWTGASPVPTAASRVEIAHVNATWYQHLLLGIIREGQGIAIGVLRSLGVNLEQMRTQTMQMLGQPNTPKEESDASE